MADEIRLKAERLIRILRRAYGIEDIVGHSDIAPGRKTDPGPYFSWGRLRRILREAGGACVALRIEPEEGEGDLMRWPFPLAGRPR